MERRPTTRIPLGHVGASVMRRWRRQRGTTLVELLTSTLFVSILMAISYSFARTALRSARMQEVKSEAQEVTVMALDVLAREIRMAGFSAATRPVTAIGTASTDRLEVAADLNGDGDTADSNERITYSVDDEKHELMRASGGGSPQPLVRNVPQGGVRFSFFDASGAEIPTSADSLPLSERRRIHRVDLLVRVEIPSPDPDIPAPFAATAAGSVCLRNQ